MNKKVIPSFDLFQKKKKNQTVKLLEVIVVDLKVSDFELDNFPSLQKDSKFIVNLVDSKNTILNTKSTTIKSNSSEIQMMNTWNLSESLIEKGRLEIQILDSKSKVMFISTVGIKYDLLENDENFNICYNPFYENLKKIELFLLPSSEYSKLECHLSLNMSLSSYTMDFEILNFKQKSELSFKILKKIHSKLSRISEEKLSDLELNYIGRIKNNKNFIKILREFSLQEDNFKQLSEEILTSLNHLQKNESYKYEFVSTPNPDQKIEEIKDEKVLKREESNEIEDLKELEMYEKNGIDKTAIHQDEYVLNLIRIILTKKIL
eukprot:gene280-6695_t